MFHALLIAVALSDVQKQTPPPTDARHGCDAIKSEPVDLSAPRTKPVGGLERPVLVRTVNTIVPQDLIDPRLSGTTGLKVLISESGCVEKVTVIKSSHRLFDDAAIAAVKKWRYLPAKRNGIAVPVYIAAAVSFGPSTR